MKNDLSPTSIKEKITAIKDYIVKYRMVLFVTLVAGITGFMIIRISIMSNAEPEAYQLQEAKSVQAIQLNDQSIEIIQQLESRNISIEALFDPGRYDPFAD